jgi:hypothetical protein
LITKVNGFDRSQHLPFGELRTVARQYFAALRAAVAAEAVPPSDEFLNTLLRAYGCKESALSHCRELVRKMTYGEVYESSNIEHQGQ